MKVLSEGRSRPLMSGAVKSTGKDKNKENRIRGRMEDCSVKNF